MSSAAALRLQIETSLATRIPGALTPRPRVTRETAATGIDELDTLLDGGLPIGAITELVGAHSSGRTTLALATMAEMTQAGKTVAWVDTSDALDPESAAATGVELSRQLWVRCGQDSPTPGSGKAGVTESPGRGAAFVVEGSRAASTSGGCGSPHPRGEARGLSEAVDAFLQPDVFSRAAPPRDPAVPRRNRMIGTPSAPNRKLLDRTPQDARPLPRRARDREEQIPTDRQPSRRQTMYAQQGETAKAKTLQAAQIAHTAALARSRPQGGVWTDNASNAHGRSLPTPPNAVAAGLPKFREMEARAAGQGHGAPVRSPWKPTFDERVFQSQKGRVERSAPIAKDDMPRRTEPLVKSSVRSSAADSAGGPQQAQAGVREEPASKAKQDSGTSLAGDPPPKVQGKKAAVWRSLDQALRATDLLLAAGGFSAVVLDLGNVAPEFAWRIPLATWFRFRAAADRARTVLLVLTQHPCARSSAELVLRCSPAEAQTAATVLTGARFYVAVDRRRFETPPCAVVPADQPQAQTLHLVTRKQPQRERGAAWHRAAVWTGTEHRQPQGGPL